MSKQLSVVLGLGIASLAACENVVIMPGGTTPPASQPGATDPTPAPEATPTPTPTPSPTLARAFAYSQSSTAGVIYQYAVDLGTGDLTPLATPTISAGSYLYYLDLDRTKDHLYAVNYSSHNVTGYSIDKQSGQLTSLGNFGLGGATNPGNIRLHPTRDCAYVANNGSGNVSAFSASGGALTHVANVATGGGATAIDVTPDGKYLYVANSSAQTVSIFEVESDCDLASVGTLSAGVTAPNDVRVHPNGQFLYVSNFSGATGSVSAFAIAGDGTLSAITGSPFLTGGDASYAIRFSDDGAYLFSANNRNVMSSSSVSVYGVNATSGALSLKSGSPVAHVGASFASLFKTFAYVMSYNQTDHVQLYDFNATSGALTPRAGWSAPVQGNEGYTIQFVPVYE